MKSESAFGKAKAWVTDSLTQENSFKAYFEPLIQMALPGWNSESVRTRVLRMRKETDDVFSLVLKPGKAWKGFKAGQHLQITAEKNGSLQTRIFSVSTSPEHFRRSGEIEMSIRVQEGGRITPWLRQEFASGGICTLSQAMGEFVLPQGNQPLLMIAGGSGITPFRSMLNQLAAENSQRDVTLLFYVRDEANALFRDEFSKIAAAHSNLNILYVDGSKEGFFSADHLNKYCPDFTTRKVMICGPTPMIQLARKTVAELGVSDDNIMFEYFGAAPIDMERAGSEAFVSFEKSGASAVTDPDSPMNLLDLAESQGLKPLSGCRAGVCYQCVCTKKSGVVYNTLTGKYSDTGQEDIQLCVTVAVNDVVLDV
tara:strand:+ start:2623 stop:3726 length:1104 start_codon:yes stop_codon:yes gene_type:complete